MLEAKHAIETLVETGHVLVDLPAIEPRSPIVDELCLAGVGATQIQLTASEGSFAAVDS